MSSKAIKKILIAALVALAGLSCTKQSLMATYNTQEQKIDTFINGIVSKDTTIRVVHNAGSHRVVLVEGEDADSLSATGNISFYYAGYTFTGNVSASALFATNHEETALASKWDLTDASYDIKTLNLSDAELLDGLRNGLEGVRAGEECYILFSGEHGFGKKAVGTIGAKSALCYHIWVESINND